MFQVFCAFFLSFMCANIEELVDCGNFDLNNMWTLN